MYRGNWGPGTLEMTRFQFGRPARPEATRNDSRAARENTAGGMKWLASWSSSAGSARWRSFISSSASCVRSSRRTGSASSVNSGARISRMRLPNVPRCSRVRTETGICATSGSSGSSSWSTSQRRTAPAQSVTTTSLTVTPKDRLTALTSSRDSWPKANRRCGETRPENDVRGARSSGCSITSLPSSPAARPTSREAVVAPGIGLNTAGASAACSAADGSPRITRSGYLAAPAAPRASISSSPGSPADAGGAPLAPPAAEGVGSRSSSNPMTSAPLIPSTTA